MGQMVKEGPKIKAFHLLSWFKKAVEEGFISSANLNELLVSDSPNQLVEMVVNHQRPSDDDWTKRLGL